MSKLAERAELNVNTLYRTLLPKGNPELKSPMALLRAASMQLTIRRCANAWPEARIERFLLMKERIGRSAKIVEK